VCVAHRASADAASAASSGRALAVGRWRGERFGRYRCLTLRYSLLLSVWVDPSAEHICTYIYIYVYVYIYIYIYIISLYIYTANAPKLDSPIKSANMEDLYIYTLSYIYTHTYIYIHYIYIYVCVYRYGYGYILSLPRMRQNWIAP